MTPEETRAHDLLRWMIAHPPNLNHGVSDYSILAGRRRVLKYLLTRLHVTSEGCIIHGNPNSKAHPSVMWPQQDGYYSGRSKGRKDRSQETRALPVRHIMTHRLLLDLWFPKLTIPNMTQPTCRNRRCVNPQHRVTSVTGAVMLGEKIGWAKKLTVEQAREICYLRLTNTAFFTGKIAEKFGIDTSQVNKIAKGENWAKDTADIRAKYEFCQRRVPLSKYREVCQLRLDNPDMDNKTIAGITGVQQDWVSKLLYGTKHAELTADIRSDPKFDPSPPRYRKGGKT